MEIGRRGFLGFLSVAPVSLKNAVKDLTARNIAGLSNPLSSGLADALKDQAAGEDPVDPTDPEEGDYYRKNMRSFLNLFRSKKIPSWKLAQTFQQARHEAISNIPLSINVLRSVSAVGKYNMATKHYFSRSFENEYNNLLLDIQRNDYEKKLKYFALPKARTKSNNNKSW